MALTEKQLKALTYYSDKNVSLYKLSRAFDINYWTAYSHIRKHNLCYKKRYIIWTDKMLEKLCKEFPVRFNQELATDLKIGCRTLVRKARELGLEKEKDFHKNNQEEITERSVANATYTYTYPSKAFLAHCFKKGVPNPYEDRIDRVALQIKRNKTIAAERMRIALGLPRQTKLRLK